MRLSYLYIVWAFGQFENPKVLLKSFCDLLTSSDWRIRYPITISQIHDVTLKGTTITNGIRASFCVIGRTLSPNGKPRIGVTKAEWYERHYTCVGGKQRGKTANSSFILPTSTDFPIICLAPSSLQRRRLRILLSVFYFYFSVFHFLIHYRSWNKSDIHPRRLRIII